MDNEIRLSESSFKVSLLDLLSVSDPKDPEIQAICTYNYTGKVIAVQNGYSAQKLDFYLKAGFNNHISWQASTEEWIENY